MDDVSTPDDGIPAAAPPIQTEATTTATTEATTETTTEATTQATTQATTDDATPHDPGATYPAAAGHDEPEDPPPDTGDQAVDDATSEVAATFGEPLEARLAAYERAHRTLQDRLA